jgi:hypothetical protein
MSIEATEAESAAVAKAPNERVSLASMEAKIAEKHEFVMGSLLDDAGRDVENSSLNLLSVCVLVMKNGFTVIGKAAPASSLNFNRELGKKFAYEDAVRQLWPLEGYALRERLAA